MYSTSKHHRINMYILYSKNLCHFYCKWPFLRQESFLLQGVSYVPCPEKQTSRNPKPFLPAEPFSVIRAGDFNKVPWIVGSTSQELAEVVACEYWTLACGKFSFGSTKPTEITSWRFCWKLKFPGMSRSVDSCTVTDFWVYRSILNYN